ncbi:hypothetical protein GYO_4428 [Bacillus spizizenii TU-B-10]|uniref:Uncharacterized protein n=1 Tax=Bacillus spizizenii (strain DSM 15029 / JCM 12233 / NBRC 101239 / NRRL B-23049 / TU-B-10) TaxID=1052585 RepID=G4NZ22_BACS4|nr:hypothetical protein GYO_4428 [Bacillus spizizenii TU-B-10]
MITRSVFLLVGNCLNINKNIVDRYFLNKKFEKIIYDLLSN